MKSDIIVPFVDFRSAFSIISPMKLIRKLHILDLSTMLCNWISDFLANRTYDYGPRHQVNLTVKCMDNATIITYIAGLVCVRSRTERLCSE